MTQRILPASLALALLCGPVVVLLIMRVGPVLAAPYLIASAMQSAIGTVLRRRPRPEYWLFAGDCVATAAIAAAVALSGGTNSPILLFFSFPLVAVAGRHTQRGLIVFSALTAAAASAACAVAIHQSLRYGDLRLVGLLTMIFGLLTLMLALMRAERLYRQQSLLDPLTGTLNRLALNRRLEELGAQAALGDGRLCIIAADVDHFKYVNDAHGHEVGDVVLCGVALALRQSLRAFPLLYRTGGEEFVALLPGLDTGEGRELAERLRTVVEQSRPGSIRVTMSFGVAASCGTHVKPDALLHAADNCLYEAKHRGRNRVITQTDPDEPPGRAVVQPPRPERVAAGANTR